MTYEPRRVAVKSRRRGLVRVGLATGILAAMATSLTVAVLTDQANLNMALGSSDRFDIGVVIPAGTVEQADGPNGYDWAVTDAEKLVPGHSVNTVIPVFNNSLNFAADTTVSMVMLNSDGRVSDKIPNITQFLRFTAARSDGKVLFADAKLADAHAALGVLAPRGTTVLQQGDNYIPGAQGSEESIKLTITYLDVPGVENYNGGQSAVAVRFEASSVRP